MSGKVKVVVKVVARADAAAQMSSIVLKLAAQSRKERGCLGYEVLQNYAEPSVFVLYEEWDSEAALDAHNTTPHFFAAVTQAQPILAQPLEVGRYTVIG